MLKRLKLNRVGPAESMELEFDRRLNVLTGDNGLGKTFVLDIAWWALTGTWAERPVLGDRLRPPSPHRTPADSLNDPAILWELEVRGVDSVREARLPPGVGPSQWRVEFEHRTIERPVLYARIDGGISIWEPIRRVPLPEGAPGGVLNLSPREIWDGKPLDSPQKLCEGLIRDWRDWQQDRDPRTMEFLTNLLQILSPTPDETIRPGSEARPIAEDDVRKIPRIVLPWGEIPVTIASAGMKRVLSLAYTLVWTWQRHRETAALFGVPPSTRMVLLIDEVEAHLHPRWQRVIVPAILKAMDRVQEGMDVQVLMTTHSPMVLASLEPLFKEEIDQLFNFRIEHGAVTVERVDWEKHGDATGWLESEVFGLGEARSAEAEDALRQAREFLDSDRATRREAKSIEQRLSKLVPGTDPFWAVWVFGLRRKGIEAGT